MKELIEIQKKLHVPKGQAPENKRYNYRKIDDIIRAVKKIAPDNVYIILTDDLVELGGNVYTKGIATISNGKESVSASAYAKEGSLPGQSDPQISGSCSTYERKKALEGLLSLDDGNDPDGNPLPKEETTKLQYINTQQKATLKDCVAKLRTNGFKEKGNSLEPLIDKILINDFDKYYNGACKILGEKV